MSFNFLTLNRNFFILTLIFLMMGGISKAQTSGGPDAYGYVWRNQAHADGPEATWIDITKRSSSVDISDKFGDDTFFGPLNFSFPFHYYWYDRNEIYIGSNGYVSFKSQLIAATFPSIPQPAGQGDDYVAPFMADLNMAGADNTGSIWFYSDFKDSVIVSFIDIPPFNPASNGNPANGNTFQVILSKVDSSVMFNYIRQDGVPNQNSSTANYLIIGIENVSGRVGIMHSKDNGGPNGQFAGVSAANPISIKFYHPGKSDYTTIDLAVLYNTIKRNTAVISPIYGTPPVISAFIFNQGLEETISGITIDGTLSSGELKTYGLPIMAPGESNIVKFPTLRLNMAAEAVYSFTSLINYEADEVQVNNRSVQMFKVIDTTGIGADGAEMLISYYPKGSANSTDVDWVGASNYDAGMGTLIESPFYPFKLVAVEGWSTGPTGVRFQVFDDDGVNLQGERDGSPGTLLFETDVVPSAEDGMNRANLPEPIQINSGGLYISELMSATAGSPIGMYSSGPRSYRTYEVLFGAWVPYRNSGSNDVMIGMYIEKGSKDEILDLSISQLISPTKDGEYADPAIDVVVELENTGAVDISGPIEISFRANSREPIVDTIPSSVTILAGEKLEFTFKQQALRPPAPKLRFDFFCVKFDLANDFDLNNNESCFTNSVGLHEKVASKGFLVYPNPAVDYLYVKSENPSVMKLISSEGKIVWATPRSIGGKISIKNLESGIYYLVAQHEKYFEYQRVMIVR